MSWGLSSLDSLCTAVYSGGTPPTNLDTYYGGEIPWLRTQEVTFNRITDTEIKITEAGLKNSAAKWVPANSVIVAMYGNSAGRSALTEIPLTTNQACCNLVIDNTKADFRFVFYALLLSYEQLKSLSRGAAQNNLNAAQVKAFEINAPSVEKQRTIGCLLSSYDDLIENNRRRMALLEESARLLYHEWFVRLRFPGYEHTRIVDGVPEGWERIPLEQVLVLQRGFDLPTQDRQEGTVPIYGSTGIVGYHDKAKVSAPGVVTGRSGTLGEVHFVSEDYWPLNTSLWVKEFKRVTPLFAVFLLREMDLRQFNGGVSVPTLDRKTAHRAEFLLPSPGLVAEFSAFTSDVFSQIKNLTLQNQKLRAARDLLLPRLMSGEIVV